MLQIVLIIVSFGSLGFGQSQGGTGFSFQILFTDVSFHFKQEWVELLNKGTRARFLSEFSMTVKL